MPFFRNQRQFQQLAFVAIVPAVIELTTLSSPVIFKKDFIYSSLATPVPVIAPPVTAVENTTLSSPVVFKSRFQYQSHTEPSFVPTVIVSVDSFYRRWSDPVKVKRGLSTGDQQALAYLPFVPEISTIDKWFADWRVPVRQPVGLKTHLQQAFFAPAIPAPAVTDTASSQILFSQEFQYQTLAYVPFISETVTVDKWIYPWTDPVRQRAELKVQLQQAAIGPVLDDETQLIQNFESRWHYPWSEPVRFRQLSTAQQQAQVQGPPVVPLDIDQWTYPWSSPIRAKLQLPATEQQFYAYPPIPDVDADSWLYPWSSPVRFKQFPTHEQQAQIQGPVSTPEFITVDKWTYSWSEPVRQKPGLATQLQQAFISPVLDDETQIIQNFESRWHYPWSEPVRIRPQLPAGEQQFYTAPPTVVFENITVDKWIYPWTDPVRQKIGLTVNLQQAFIAPVLDDETQIIQTFESRWHFAWSEPVRVKPQLPAGEQQAVIQGPVQTPEFITVDKWIYPWTDPVRQKIGLKIHLQQAFIAPVLDNTTQIINTFESPWHFPWSEPVRFRQLATAQQQTAAFQPPSFEVLTIDKWGFAWSEPVRQKPGLRASLQQSLIATTLDNDTQIIQTFESRWHYAWSEPVRIRPQVPAGEQQALIQPTFTPEFITVDKWAYAWSEPVRQKIGIAARLQQAFIAPVLADEQLTGTIESRWHQSWSEPVRFRRFPTAEQQSFAAPATSVFETITVDKWIYPWTDPVKQKLGLKTNLQQAFIATTLEPNTQIIQTYESRWHQPWSDPIRRVVSAANQPSFTWHLFTPTEIITLDKWFSAWQEPVKRLAGLKTQLQQAIFAPVIPAPVVTESVSSPVLFSKEFQYQSYTSPAQFTPEVIAFDKWGFAWSEPSVKQKKGLGFYLQQAAIGPVLNPETQIIQKIESRWHYPWSEPVRKKPGLGAWLQDTTAPKTPIFPTGIARLSQWFAPLSEPVRLRLGLRAGLQRFFQSSQEVVLPDVFVTLSATETNNDSAFFGVTVYNAVPVVTRVPTVVVSIKEIPVIRTADVSTEELPAIGNANVSIEET